jgi:hypothetical protein
MDLRVPDRGISIFDEPRSGRPPTHYIDMNIFASLNNSPFCEVQTLAHVLLISKVQCTIICKMFYISNLFIVDMCHMIWHATSRPNESKLPDSCLQNCTFRNKMTSIFKLQEMSRGLFWNTHQIICGSWWTIMCLIVFLEKSRLKNI